jgi:hypothetical protein
MEFHEMTHALSPRLADLKTEYESACAAERAAQAAIDNNRQQKKTNWSGSNGTAT